MRRVWSSADSAAAAVSSPLAASVRYARREGTRPELASSKVVTPPGLPSRSERREASWCRAWTSAKAPSGPERDTFGESVECSDGSPSVAASARSVLRVADPSPAAMVAASEAFDATKSLSRLVGEQRGAAVGGARVAERQGAAAAIATAAAAAAAAAATAACSAAAATATASAFFPSLRPPPAPPS